jgi:hypothetical protein
MQTVDDRPETIHLYVVREEQHPSYMPIVLSLIALFILVVCGVAFPYVQPEQEAVIQVPAVFLPIQNFGISVPIIPTGRRTIGATTAHGVLTITNGSIISQTLPKGMIIGNVALDYSIFVPAGSANGYGYATVSAHALVSGNNGNIRSLNIDVVEGESIYIRNLVAFTGGRDAFKVLYTTEQDRLTAFDSARAFLTAQEAKIHDYLAYPCNESAQVKNSVLRLFCTCQYVTYNLPKYMKVVHVKLVGKTLFVDVRFVERTFAIVK